MRGLQLLTSVRRSASHAVLDALRPIPDERRRSVTRSVTQGVPTLERAQR
ncbi:Unknown protein sequence [Pseudomonas amygdali pv. lachrymans]|uniref:Uncharacterized protein n=1 Tax=Pseudomonas syringae pv. maculicola TaxID=59511 RepID=A0A0P9UF45_PSEYM|nr:Unknown protein sequence [Pseudomonas amygdali pv. lachrymans]KPX76515.1 hypothetical protein ALO84_101841 [Pseudomonas syringae pv. maculicola]RMM05800.1 hypothetical protein ALQ85_102112 [Pseudomonas syringae]RMV44062.1 hypothetical protein ALP13_103080 [Pseudomonas syringae pv. maculicola]